MLSQLTELRTFCKMAVENDAEATQAFPNPPLILYRLYTDENVASGVAPKPPVPVKGNYQMFGALFNTEDSMIRPLEDQGIQKLYPQDYDKKAELKKLNRSILVCFLELLDILINNPSSPERNQKINDLSILFINMHHLINEYRPHQARETLRVILERQKKQREEIIQHIHKAMEKAQTVLKSCENLLSQTVSGLPPVDKEGSSEDNDETEEMEVQQMTSSNKDNKELKETNEQFTVVDQQDTELCKLIKSLMNSH